LTQSEGTDNNSQTKTYTEIKHSLITMLDRNQ